ncbi:hypothetical protein Mooltan_082 [Salmonella phage Mooltan]|nr:hypothetical protein Mooltan_082 [Salmonella phage Mooltan]
MRATSIITSEASRLIKKGLLKQNTINAVRHLFIARRAF